MAVERFTFDTPLGRGNSYNRPSAKPRDRGSNKMGLEFDHPRRFGRRATSTPSIPRRGERTRRILSIRCAMPVVGRRPLLNKNTVWMCRQGRLGLWEARRGPFTGNSGRNLPVGRSPNSARPPVQAEWAEFNFDSELLSRNNSNTVRLMWSWTPWSQS